MHPLLIDLGEVTLPWLGTVHLALPSYGLCVATAVLIAWFWYTRRAAADGVSPDAAGQAALWAVFAGLAGGKIGLLIVEAPYYLDHPGEIFSIRFLQAAGVIWAAVLAGIVGMLVLAWVMKLPVARLLDAAAVPLPLAQAIGRIGCLLGGCCFGGHCELPWGITYTAIEARVRTGVPLNVPLHPTPVYEILWSLCFVLPMTLLASRRRKHPGEVLLVYLAAYSLGRFFIEFWRGDSARGVWFGGQVSTSQLISLIIAPLAMATWFWLRTRPLTWDAPDDSLDESSPEEGGEESFKAEPVQLPDESPEEPLK